MTTNLRPKTHLKLYSELSGLKLALQAKKKLTKKNKKVQKLTRSLARVKKELDQEEKVLTSNVLNFPNLEVFKNQVHMEIVLILFVNLLNSGSTLTN